MRVISFLRIYASDGGSVRMKARAGDARVVVVLSEVAQGADFLIGGTHGSIFLT
ncbi:hypothetical protein [Salipiger thiooxidans]|uniref:hypothetical protein n=1 Tax=Salipiger thiooxidans TaxID=282683 RepID=UPI0013F4D147|nr:hypothetical protein [Salipiger thiooxidans]